MNDHDDLLDSTATTLIGLLLTLGALLGMVSTLFIDLRYYFLYGGFGAELALWLIGLVSMLVPLLIGILGMSRPNSALARAWTPACAAFVPLAFGIYLTGRFSTVFVDPEPRSPEIFTLLYTAGWGAMMAAAAMYVLANLRGLAVPTHGRAAFRWWIVAVVAIAGWAAWQAVIILRGSLELIPWWWWVIAGLGVPSCLAGLVLVGALSSAVERFLAGALVGLLLVPVVAIWIGLPKSDAEWHAVWIVVVALVAVVLSLTLMPRARPIPSGSLP